MFYVCAPINHFPPPPVSLLSFILLSKAIFCAFFLSFILSHWLHHYFYSYCATTYVISKNKVAALMKIVLFFDFHFIPNYLKMFFRSNDLNLCYDRKFIANYDYPLYIKKKSQCLNCDKSYNICLCVKCMEKWMFVEFISKEKQNRKSENVVVK